MAMLRRSLLSPIAMAMVSWTTLACAAVAQTTAPNALKVEFDRLTDKVTSGAPGQSMLAEIPAATALAARYAALGDRAQEGRSYVTAANLAQLGTRYREAVRFADRAIVPCTAARDWVCVGRANNTAAVALGRIDDPYGAMRRLRNAAAKFKAAGRADLALVTRMNAANIQADLGDTRGALAEYRAIDAAITNRLDPMRTGLLTTIGNLLLELNDPTGARAAALETFGVLRAERLGDRSGWTTDQRLAALETLGLAEAHLGHSAASMVALREYVASAAAGDSDFEKYESNYAMAKALLILGKAAEARPFLERALSREDQPDAAGRIELYKLAARIANAGGDAAAAYSWLEKANTAQSALLSGQVRSSLADALAAANVAQRDAAIVSGREQSEAALWQTRAWAAGLLGLTMTIGLVVFNRFRTGSLLKRQQAVIEERSRLARDMHDRVLQGLAGLSLGVQAAARRLSTEPEAVGPMLMALSRDAQRALVDARDTVWDVRRPETGAKAFEESLAELVAKVTDGSAVDVVLKIDGDWANLSQSVRTAVLRIIEEAVRNSLQHGAATQVLVQAAATTDDVTLLVRDNGIGFTVNPVIASLGGHWGVLGMRERAENLGGKLTIVSGENRGVEVSAIIPRNGVL